MPKRQYVFSASGAHGVMAAFRGIGKSATSSARKVKQSADQMRAATQALARKSGGRTYVLSDPNQLRKEGRARQAALVKQYDKERLDQQKHLDKVAKNEARAQKRMARARNRAIGNAARVAGRVGLYAAGTAAAGVAAIVGSAARDSIALQDTSTRLAIKGSGYGHRADPTQLRRSFESSATKWKGVEATELAAATGSFVERSGDLGQAMEFQDVWAQFMLATGTKGDELGRVAADLFEKFDITTVEGMSKALAGMAVQGKRGAFEITDAAKQFPKMAAMARSFGIQGGSEGVSRLGALSQIARKGTGSGAQAGTAVENLFRVLLKKSDILKRELGVDVFTDSSKTKTNDIRDVAVQTVMGTKGDLSKLPSNMSIRSFRALSHLVTVFNSSAGTMADKSAALYAEWDKLEAAAGAEAQIKQDAAIAQKQTSSTITGAMETLKAAIGEELTPQLVSLAKKFTTLATETDLIENVVSLFSALADGVEGAISALEEMGLIEKRGRQAQVLKESKKLKIEEDKFFGEGAAGSKKKAIFDRIMGREDMMRENDGGNLSDANRQLLKQMFLDYGAGDDFGEYDKGKKLRLARSLNRDQSERGEKLEEYAPKDTTRRDAADKEGVQTMKWLLALMENPMTGGLGHVVRRGVGRAAEAGGEEAAEKNKSGELAPGFGAGAFDAFLTAMAGAAKQIQATNFSTATGKVVPDGSI